MRSLSPIGCVLSLRITIFTESVHVLLKKRCLIKTFMRVYYENESFNLNLRENAILNQNRGI